MREALKGAVRAIKVLCDTIVETVFRIPIRILKRLSGTTAATVTLGSYGTELFKLWCLLCLGTLLGAPMFVLSLLSTLMLVITGELIYVYAQDINNFVVEC